MSSNKLRRAGRRCLLGLAATLLVIAALPLPCTAQDDSKIFYGRLPESYARKSAVRKIMPSYPEEAIRKGTSGTVRLKIEISAEGEVLRVKVNPSTDPLLKRVTVEAVREWHFKPYPDRQGLDRSSLSRLTFVFTIRNGKPVVDLYNPGPTAPDSERLGYYNSAKELREWDEWEEVPNEISKPPR